MEESFAPNQLSFILKKKLVDMSSGKNEKHKYELITRNLQEVLGADRLKQFIETSKEPLKLYWGTATTGRPHIAYFLPITKIGDFLRAGCQVTILLADLHAYLDNMKAPWRLLSLRTRYYEHIIKAMLRSIKVPIEKLKFVKGTEYQLSQEYTLDVYKISSIVTEHDAKKAGSEVVKQVQNPLLSGLLYPCLQALDEHYLNVDAQFGGVDQRKIFTLAEKYLPAIGYSKRIHLMNPMVPGLTGTKMSASEEDSKIDLLDSPTVVARKIKRAFCEPGNIENNGLLPFVRYVIFPVFEQIDEHGFRVKRPEKFGGDVVYGSYEELEASFAKQELHPGDLKLAVASYINRLLAPIIAEFQSPELNELKEKAYEQTGVFPKTSEEIAGSLKATVVQPTVEPFVLDLRVGRIISAREHPNANSLYVEEIDVGEEAPRTVISGLVPYMTIDQLTEAPEHREHSYCVVLCNCKPLRMKEIESQGLLLIAYSDEKPKNKVAEIIRPPEGAKPGDRIWFEGYHQNDGHHRSYTFTELNPKKKVWESIRSDLRTDNKGIVRWRGSAMRTIEGTIAVHKLINAPIK